MPKYVIRETKPEAEPTVDVWLEIDDSGTVVMKIGSRTALYIRPDGTLYRLRAAANKENGLRGDPEGRILLVE